MGGITSKFVDTVVSESEQDHTPKGKRLPFDPRSPSEQIARTPIMTLDTPTNHNRMETPSGAKTDKVVDPRSPNCDVNRTPIVVEKKEAPRRPLTLKPTTEMKLDSFLCAPNDENEGEDEQDPRSPTTKVPRTPLEDKVLDLEITKSSDTEEDQVISTETEKQEGEDTQEENKSLVKKLFSSEEVDKARRPLGQVRNTVTAKTPRDLLQAKHCKNVEVEYNKNIRSLLPDQENVIHSKTDFVEDI